MNRRHYQLFALSILIGAPLLVSIATNSVAPAPDAAPAAGEPAGEPAPDAPQAEAVPPPIAQPLAQPAPTQPGQMETLASAAPTLDTTGMQIAVIEPVGINVGAASSAANPGMASPAMNIPSADAPSTPPAEQTAAPPPVS